MITNTASRNPLVHFQQAFERGFERLRHSYQAFLTAMLNRRATFVCAFLAACVSTFPACPLARPGLLPELR